MLRARSWEENYLAFWEQPCQGGRPGGPLLDVTLRSEGSLTCLLKSLNPKPSLSRPSSPVLPHPWEHLILAALGSSRLLKLRGAKIVDIEAVELIPCCCA